MQVAFILLFCFLLLLAIQDRALAKTGSTLYPPALRNNAQRNIERYEWARAQRDHAIKAAEPYVTLSDQFLWEWVPEQTMSRSHQVNQVRVCPSCGPGIPKDGGPKFTSDPFHDRWHIRCTTCGEVFPKNDFGAFYQSGKDEHYLFDPRKADRSPLVNSAHADPADPLNRLQVDDGIGWTDAKDGEVFFFVGLCGDLIWTEILKALQTLSEAYLLTGEQRYAHKAAILLDRIADVYPSMDLSYWSKLGHYQSHGGTGWGKIRGCIWETGVAKTLAQSYDAIYPGMESDADLVSFLSSQASKYRLPGDKASIKGIREHIETDIIREIGHAVIMRDIQGNHGMHQSTMAIAAIVLDDPKTSEEWIRWIFKRGIPRGSRDKKPAPGGDLLRVLASEVDRDGMGDEASPGYNSIWPSGFLSVAEVLDRSERYRDLSPLRNSAQLRRMFDSPIEQLFLGKYVPSIGDSGKTGSPGRSGLSKELYVRAYQFWREPRLAQIIFLLNDNTAKDLRGSIYDPEPDELASSIEKIIKEHGELKLKSANLDGYGFTALRSGEGDHERALWLYYGRNTGHGHADTLNLGMYGFGIDLLPDLGYPEYTGPWPSRLGWTSNTISHNTVMVNRRRQDRIWVGRMRLFSAGPLSQVVEVSAKPVYKEVRQYRRTSVLVDISPEDFYVVDIFRVVGGEDHRWSFHAAEGPVLTQGLALMAQGQGTYAGPDIPFGAPYDGELTWGYPGSGFQYLYDVRRDPEPGPICSAEWHVRDTWKAWEKERDVRVRVTLLDPPGEVALAHGDPPQNKPGNPRRLTYLLVGGRPMRRDTSTFISVIEPYEGRRKIRSITRVPIIPVDEPRRRLQAVALKIECMDGRTDYVISAEDGKINRTVDGEIQFAGRFGMLSIKDGHAISAHLVGGTKLAGFGAEITMPAGALTGVVRKMSHEPEQPSWIETDAVLPEDGSLIGRWIQIDNDGARDAAYRIAGIQRLEEGRTRIGLGRISLARGLKEIHGEQPQYVYDFGEGAKFTILLEKQMK